MQLIVDFHCHTCASGDSLATPSAIIRWAQRRGLDRLVVTDHDTISGGVAAKSLDPDLIIIGEEIMTTDGELLAIYVSQEIPAGLTPNETIRRLRDQGAFISVSHPFDSWRSGAWNTNRLSEIVPQLDAIEVFNARCMISKDNLLANEFANLNRLAGTAGSDAHAAFEVGSAKMVLPYFSNPDELRVVINKGVVQGRLSPFWVHLFSRYANLRKKVV